MKVVLISLGFVKYKPAISWNYTGLLSNFYDHHGNTLEIKLSTGTVYLSKYEYLNRLKVYENGTYRFLITNYKRVNKPILLKFLLQYEDAKKSKTITLKTNKKKIAART